MGGQQRLRHICANMGTPITFKEDRKRIEGKGKEKSNIKELLLPCF